ncbi:hypothetical protein Ahy_B03g067399 isoform A [Arachis hypogaea]|uniref:FAR1 domain-containing protein n=1 Tax=Arachis hypogaea TaxID=3818 RepID=A0A445A6P5_ARAHY|nr:hypothetical protein Ahy_B03g067399 isoform A [Arachis hypogaea]
MEYTGHSEKFCTEDESNCVGDVVSSDADEFDVEQLDPSGQDDLSDYGDIFSLTAAEIENKVFRTEECTYEFYMRFGKCHGFGVRKGDYGKDDDGNVIRKRFFYNRAELRDEKHYNRLDRKRCHKSETQSLNWKVRKVILEHNHELVARCMVHLIPKFRRVSGAANDQLDGMQSYGLPLQGRRELVAIFFLISSGFKPPQNQMPAVHKTAMDMGAGIAFGGGFHKPLV